MVAPLLARDQVIGMTAVWRFGSGRPFTEAELNFLVGLSQQAAAAIENARLFEAQREAEDRFRRLVEELPLVLYIDTPVRAGRPATRSSEPYVSPQVEDMFGFHTDWMAATLLGPHPSGRPRTCPDRAGHGSRRPASREHPEYRSLAPTAASSGCSDESGSSATRTARRSTSQGFWLNITERKELEETLRAREAELALEKQYYESLVTLSPTAIVTMDLEEHVTSWNPAAERLFG